VFKDFVMGYLKRACRFAVTLLLGLVPSFVTADDAADANNPLANVRAFNIQG